MLSYTYCKHLQVSLKTQKNIENTFCTISNQIYRFSNRILSYKMSSDKHECIPIFFYELNLTTLPTDKFHLTEEHEQAQNNILEKHFILYKGIRCENIYN